ncbi:MAG TPA: GNAT family N-acetyltransferase [Candidatus Limiplasma sp.]|nr:GNAT family N-acetyltransferase [Candidatus Limiplasma sp.]HRX09720.1 GNAT family N-acetyltransferase [Candidatus Limiplasma sp.]
MSVDADYCIVPLGDDHRSTVQALIEVSWAGPMIVVDGRLWDTRIMPGFAALDAQHTVIGYICYVLHPDECEIMVLESLRENAGIGSRLIETVKATAQENGIKKVAAMTTNDNLHALRFYQKRGFTMRALRPNMLETSRKLKPGIPLLGIDGIPLRDEIELVLTL